MALSSERARRPDVQWARDLRAEEARLPKSEEAQWMRGPQAGAARSAEEAHRLLGLLALATRSAEEHEVQLLESSRV